MVQPKVLKDTLMTATQGPVRPTRYAHVQSTLAPLFSDSSGQTHRPGTPRCKASITANAANRSTTPRAVRAKTEQALTPRAPGSMTPRAPGSAVPHLNLPSQTPQGNSTPRSACSIRRSHSARASHSARGSAHRIQTNLAKPEEAGVLVSEVLPRPKHCPHYRTSYMCFSSHHVGGWRGPRISFGAQAAPVLLATSQGTPVPAVLSPQIGSCTRSRSDPNLGLRRCIISGGPSPRGRSSESRMFTNPEAQAVLHVVSPRHLMLSPRQIIAPQPASMPTAPSTNAVESCTQQNSGAKQNPVVVGLREEGQLESTAHERVKPVVTHQRSSDTDTSSNSDTKTILSAQEDAEEHAAVIIDPVRFEVTPCRLPPGSNDAERMVDPVRFEVTPCRLDRDCKDYEKESDYSPCRKETEYTNEIPPPPRTAPLLNFAGQQRQTQQEVPQKLCNEAPPSMEILPTLEDKSLRTDRAVKSSEEQPTMPGAEPATHLTVKEVEQKDASSEKAETAVPATDAVTASFAASTEMSRAAVLEHQLALALAENERLRAAANRNKQQASVTNAEADGQSAVSEGQHVNSSMNPSLVVAPRVLHAEFASPVKAVCTENTTISLQTPPRMMLDAALHPSSLQDSLQLKMPVHGVPSPQRRHKSPNGAQSHVAVSKLDTHAQFTAIQYNGQQVLHAKTFVPQPSSSRAFGQPPSGPARLGGA
eukprot:gnl/MRDRNA2_/MRDRNA2_76930_c0_seq2.p1 gnl/MRDRNA2_/MRDRNA2_76930_c0~~gnl/MRDRNA2_/MRDRNA2_76930_c0_seq2.p1  ORF type:complete len:704 (+),score=106.31 gnl/MRDRNA2_/MRDRNA2_76930_c0_seq2:72-2183(+)